MGKFLGFVGGILATIIGGYAVWYITRPITVEGMIVDRSTNNYIGKATVNVQVGSGSNSDSFRDVADGNGSYGVELTGSAWHATVVLRPNATGYRDEGPTSFVVTFGVNHHDLYVTPVASPIPPATGGTPAVNRPTMARPPAYIRKATMEKVLVKKYP